MQLMQTLVQNQQNQQVGGAPRDKRGEFLKGYPPLFSHATDPLEADDWLRAVEISKIWMFLLDVRCLEEEEAEVMEVFPHTHHHHHLLLSNF